MYMMYFTKCKKEYKNNMKKFFASILSAAMLAAVPFSANAYEVTENKTAGLLADEISKIEKAYTKAYTEEKADNVFKGYELSGNVNDTIPSSATKSIAIGDADGDGNITSSDALMILRASVSLESVPSEIGDVDEDGKITSSDALMVLRHSVGFKESDRIGVTVRVNIIDPTGISLNQTSVTIDEGKSITLKATVSPSDATYKTVTWTTSNSSVATVSGGTVRGMSAGTALITATTSNGKTAVCTVTVKENLSPEVVNCRKLINYITTHSNYTDTTGYKGIGTSISKETYSSVVYDSKTDTILFLNTHETDVNGTRVRAATQLRYDYKNGTVSDKTIVTAESAFSFTAVADYKASEIKVGQVLTYSVSNLYGTDNEHAQRIANSYRNLTLIGADIIISENTNMTLKDIGFKNFDYN